MKKIFMLFMVMTLCASVALVSCKKQAATAGVGENVSGEPAITLEEVKADPMAAIENSTIEALQQGIFKTFENIGKLENVHISLAVPSAGELEVWASEKEEAPGFAVKISNEQLEQNILLHFTNTEAVVGFDENVYGVAFENFKENFENAKFWEFSGITPDEFYEALEEELGFTLEEISGMIDTFVSQLAEYEAAADEGYLEILENAAVTVEQEKLEISSGEIDAIIVDYSIDTDLLEDFSYYYLETVESNPLVDFVSAFYPDYEYSYALVVDQYEEMFDMLISEFDKYVDSFDLQYVINSANGKLSVIAVEFTSQYMDDPDATYRIELDYGYDYMTSDTLFLNACTLRGDEKELNGVVEIKETHDEKEYSLIVTAAEYTDGKENEKIELFSIGADIDAGRYAVTSDGSELIKGNFSAEKGLFSADIDGVPMKLSVEYDDKFFSFELEVYGESMAFAIGDEKLPEIPEYKNLFEMTEEEFAELSGLLAAVGEDEPDFSEEESTVEYDADSPQKLLEYVEYMKNNMGDIAESEMLDVDILARNNSVVYKFTYKVDIGSTDSVKKALTDSLDSMAEQLSGYCSQMSAEAGVEVESLIYEYYTVDGELIVSREYK